MSKPLYHVRAYYSCSPDMMKDLDRMSFITGLSKSEIIRIAVNELIEKWKEKKK